MLNASPISEGARFHILIVSLMHVFRVRGFLPGSINFPGGHEQVFVWFYNTLFLLSLGDSFLCLMLSLSYEMIEIKLPDREAESQTFDTVYRWGGVYSFSEIFNLLGLQGESFLAI